MTLSLIYKDTHIAVIEKPPGESLLADRMGGDAFWDTIKAELPGAKLVHRLDKGTSGVLLVALSTDAQKSLNRQFAAHTIRKSYLAKVDGVPAPRSATIDLPLCPGRKSRYRIAGLREDITLDKRTYTIRAGAAPWPKNAFPSVTRFRTIATDGDSANVLLHPQTGRTHQLRVHMQWIGHPLRGDSLYNKAPGDERLALHCRAISVWCDWEPDAPPRWRRWKSKEFSVA